ncbi:MAG: GNAT family N-acetyltransferase, partial [Actinomycetota bacterium]
FFTEWSNLDPFIDDAIAADGQHRFDLIATTGSPPKVVAHAMYAAVQPQRAEVAFAVDDSLQQRGIGTILLGQLAEVANANGITMFEATTLAENRKMIGVFRECGFNGTIRALPGEISVELPTSMSPEATERFDARDRISAAAAVRSVLAPHSIAVIGASRDPTSIGGAVLGNLIAAGYTGPIYPVNPAASEIQGLAARPGIGAVGEPIELGVVVVPSDRVLEVSRDCGEAGVRALVVISAGFKEIGPEGAERERELLSLCRSYGMRLVGPNCFGVLNTDPAVSMNATFGRRMPYPGNVALLSQSGALGLAAIDRTEASGVGLSSFVSNGNKADISGNDLLSFWETDERTKVILLYLESFGNPRRFARVARHVSRSKPIVVVKSGRSRAGARATTSHTGALIAASDVTVDALFTQSGVVRCNTLPELFDVAKLMSLQPIPDGDRVAIVTNAGGPAILCADTCESSGLHVADLSTEVQSALREFLPTEASVRNPADMIASASGEQFRRSIETIASADGFDAIIAIYIPPLVTRPEEIQAAIESAARTIASMPKPIPLIYVFMSPEPVQMNEPVPTYPYPEEAARALAKAAAYGRWRAAPAGTRRTFDDLRAEEVAAVIAGSLGQGGGWLGPDDVRRILEHYRISVAPQRVAPSTDAAVAAARDLGYPVALKAVAQGLIHKTDAGAVALDLANDDAVETAASAMAARIMESDGTLLGFIVQRMVPSGVEMLVGVVNDPLFGPVIAVGAGGVTTEVQSDVAVRITPLTDVDVNEMIGTLRTARLLHGYRGSPPTDVAALEDVIHRIGALVEAHPEIAELDCNPVIVSTDSAVVVDARIRVESADRRTRVGTR